MCIVLVWSAFVVVVIVIIIIIIIIIIVVICDSHICEYRVGP